MAPHFWLHFSVAARKTHIRVKRSALLCSALLIPMGAGIEIPSDEDEPPSAASDNEETRTTTLRFGAGGGTYGRTVHASRVISLGYSDCFGYPATETFEGDFLFKDEFRDYGGELDIQAGETMHVGARGGWVSETVSYLGSSLDQAVIDTLFAGTRFDDSFDYFYMNPFIARETEHFGLGLGFIYSDNRLWTDDTQEYGDHDDATFYPTGHLRLGSLHRVYLNFSLWEGVPVYSGGGMFVAGIGLRPVPPLELFGGMATGGPYSDDHFIVRANADIGDHVTLGASLRLPGDAADAYYPAFEEIGGSVSLGYRFLRR